MMIVPFHPDHLTRLKLQPKQGGALSGLTTDQSEMMAGCDIAWTALDGDEVVACAGIMHLWEGRGHAWALLSGNIGRRMVQMHRAVKRAIELSGYRRIEMDVDAEFAEAKHWARLLGFIDETPHGMPGYSPDGRLYHKFARVI
jgi:hypothetical protein